MVCFLKIEKNHCRFLSAETLPVWGAALSNVAVSEEPNLKVVCKSFRKNLQPKTNQAKRSISDKGKKAKKKFANKFYNVVSYIV